LVGAARLAYPGDRGELEYGVEAVQRGAGSAALAVAIFNRVASASALDSLACPPDFAPVKLFAEEQQKQRDAGDLDNSG
jgi:hypothetical protein